MANEGLYQLLTGGATGLANSEQDYLQQDPFYMGGVGVSKWQLPQANNNIEAILGPALQGLLTGGLTGYGKHEAMQQAYTDYAANPLLHRYTEVGNVGPVTSGSEYAKLLSGDQSETMPYASTEMPAGWNMKQGKADLVRAALMDSARREDEQKKLDIKGNILNTIAHDDPEAAIALARSMGIDFSGAENIQARSSGINRKLDKEERESWAKKLDIPLEEADVRLKTPADLDREMRIKGLQGERMRPMTPTETAQITSSDNFRTRIKEMKDLLAQIKSDSSIGRALKGGKMFESVADTSSPEYKFYSILKAAQQEYGKSKDSGNLSTFDVQLWGPLFEGIPLLDSKKTLEQRLDYIDKNIVKAKIKNLENLKKGSANTEGFEPDRQALIKELNGITKAPGGVIPPPKPGFARKREADGSIIYVPLGR